MKAIGLLAAFGLMVGCASAPKAVSERQQLDQDARQSLAQMQQRDSSLRPLLDQATGYIIFPRVKAGGFIVGAGAGKGVVFKGGEPIGYAQLSKAEVGAVAGGQEYAELVVVKDPQTFEKMRNGNFDFGAQASAVIIHSGAADTTSFGANGIAVYVQPRGGAMLNLSLTGQRIKFTM